MAPSFLSIINLTIICGVSLMIQIVFWYGFFNRLKPSPEYKKTESHTPSVCILICVKNGAGDLQELLPILMNQDYPKFKILIANDHSSDATENIVKAFQSKMDLLKYFNVKENSPGKKRALIEAIDKIDTDWILFTDVDCRPSSDQWISSMINASISESKSIILGYSPYMPSNSFLSKWIAFENWLIGVLYMSFALINKPYMGVGRNMAIRSSIYTKEHLESHLHISSGDDDLTLQSLFDNNNLIVNVSPDSFMWTKPENSLKSYFNQKRRHFSTANAYPVDVKTGLTIFPLSIIIFYISASILLFKFMFVGLYFLIIRWLLILPVFRRLKRLLNLGINVAWFIPFDILLAIYYSIFSISFILPKQSKWS